MTLKVNARKSLNEIVADVQGLKAAYRVRILYSTLIVRFLYNSSYYETGVHVMAGGK